MLIEETGADGPRSEGGRRVLLDNSRVYVRFLSFVGGRFHLNRLSATELFEVIRQSRAIRPLRALAFTYRWTKYLDLRVSATSLPEWTITPLFYSRSTDLPVLRGRRCVRGALNLPHTGGLYNKFAF